MNKIAASTYMLMLIIALSCTSENYDFGAYKWIDLSYAYDSKTPFWPTANGFQLDTVSFGMTDKNYFYSAFSFTSAEHGGTHIDAPIHFSEGKRTVDEIPLQQLIGSGIVIDISQQSSEDIDYLITEKDIEDWEATHGIIEEGTIVLLRTGYGKFWPNKKLYMGTDQKGPLAVALLHFPGLDAEAATWLTTERSIKAVGIDTPSIDFGRSSDFMTHRILMDNNIPAFENLANLDQLPATGFQIIALPMKIKGGSGGPLRIIAGIAN